MSEKKQLKYQIIKWNTPYVREQIMKELCISEKTYYVKINAVCGEKQGFEYCQLLLIAAILNRDIHELITPEAIHYYTLHKEEQL